MMLLFFFVKIRFILDCNLFLLLKINCKNFQWCLQFVSNSSSYFGVLWVTTLPLSKKMSVPLSQKLLYQSIFEFKYSFVFLFHIYYNYFLVLHDRLRLQNNLEDVLLTTLVRMTEQRKLF